MAEESPPKEQTHAERVGPTKRNRSLRVLSSDSRENWPANLGELLEWYTNEVEDVTRAAQIRLRSATKLIAEYRRGEVSFEEARKRVSAHDLKWGHKLPGQVEDVVRGQSDEEIHRAINAFRARGQSR